MEIRLSNEADAKREQLNGHHRTDSQSICVDDLDTARKLVQNNDTIRVTLHSANSEERKRINWFIEAGYDYEKYEQKYARFNSRTGKFELKSRLVFSLDEETLTIRQNIPRLMMEGPDAYSEIDLDSFKTAKEDAHSYIQSETQRLNDRISELEMAAEDVNDLSPEELFDHTRTVSIDEL